MKKSTRILSLSLAAAILMSACSLFGPKSDIDGFKKTKSGLHYKIEKSNKSAQQVKMGDVIVGQMIFRLEDDTLFSNTGKSDRLLQVRDSVFNGYSIDEGLLMLHKGDKATFAIFADSVAKFFQPQQLPPNYEPGKGQIFYYELTVDDIVSQEELAQEQENMMREMEERQKNEPEIIANYIAENNITTAPNADGLYIIVNKKGNGPKVAEGREVKIDYTGHTLDGQMFDSSREADAKEGGIYTPQRPYEPLSYTVGQMSLIQGWMDGIKGMPQGSELTLIIPSKLAYGANGAGQTILPYTPLRFDITIVEVK